MSPRCHHWANDKHGRHSPATVPPTAPLAVAGYFYCSTNKNQAAQMQILILVLFLVNGYGDWSLVEVEMEF